MLHLRTSYRFVGLLLAAALLFGPAVPLVRAACAMDAGAMDAAMHGDAMHGAADNHGPQHARATVDSRESRAMHVEAELAALETGPMAPSEMPCGMHDDPATRPDAVDVDAPGCDEIEESYRICCFSADTAPTAVVLTGSSNRITGLLATAILPGSSTLPARPEGTVAEPASAPPAFTSTIRHQALLATFLI